MARPITYDPSVVLDRAIDLFWDRGYQAVSVDDIVRNTGLNRHSLYGRYGNKFGLLKAALERYCDTCLTSVRDVLDAPGPAIERIERLLSFRDPDCDSGFYQRMLAQGCLGFRIGAELRDTHPELEALMRDRMTALGDLLATVIRDGQAEGNIRNGVAAEELATIVLDGYLAPLLLPSNPRRKQAILSVLN